MPTGAEAIPEVMDYGEEIVRVGENLDVFHIKHEAENEGSSDWHPSDVGVIGKHDGFLITNSSNGSFHKQGEENQPSVDEIKGNKEDEHGTSPELSRDTSHIEGETNTPRIESLPLIPEVHHIGNEVGEPLVEEQYVKEVEDGTFPELPVPEFLSGKEIDMEEVNEDVRVGLVEPSIELETRMGEKYEATEDMKYEEQKIITYRGRGLVEEGYQGNLPKDGLITENIMQAEKLKEKDDSVFVEDEVNDLVEVATEPQISEGSSPEEKIDVEVTKTGEVVSDTTDVGDDSVNDFAYADVSAKEDGIPGEDIPETRDDNADSIGDGVSKEEEVQADVITNDGLSKDRELTSTKMLTDETGLQELEAPSNGDSVSHPETEQQFPNLVASLVKEGGKESGADLADATGEITEQVTFNQDDAAMDSNVCREIFNNNPDEDPSSGKPDLISESYAEPVKEVNESEDKGNRVTEGTNTEREHDPVPELTQSEFQPNVAEEEFPSSAMASNGTDIIQEDDKSSGFVISEDVGKKSADVSFKLADTIPRGDDDVEAYFVIDDNADTTKEVSVKSAKKTDYASDPIETGEVVEEKDVAYVQAATIPHGDDDVEAYIVKDDDTDTTKEVTEESAEQTDDASGPLETNVPIVADSSEDFTLQETQIHPERENLHEASIPSSEEAHFVENDSKNGNDNVMEYASEEVLSTAEKQPLDVPSASLEVELESEETRVGEDVRSHPGVSPLTDAANEVSGTQTVEAPEVLEEEKLDVHKRSAELDMEISSTLPENSNIDEQVASNEDSKNSEGTAAATVPTGSNIQEEVVEGISALELDEAPKQLEVLEETETSARDDATNENFEQQETEFGSKQASEIADQVDDADTTKGVTEESPKETDGVSSPLEKDVPIVADSSEDFTLQETPGIHTEREIQPEASIPSSEEVHFVENVSRKGNDNLTEYASEEVLSTVENQPLDVPSANLELELESDETGVGEDVRSHPGVLPLTDAANEVRETQTVEAPEVLEEEKLERSMELGTEISSTVPEDSNIDEQVATNEDSNCKGMTAAATLPTGSKIQEEVVDSISALELDETPKQVEVVEETETSAGDATNENFVQSETEAGIKQPIEIVDQGDTTLTEVPDESIKQVAVDTALPSIDLQDSRSDEQSVPTEAPKYEGISAAEVVTKRETPEEDSLIGSFHGEAEAQIGSSEFSEAPKIQGIQEDIVHSEDVQDSVSGISNETLAGSGIENDKDSTDILEKDLIDGTEKDEKVDAEEVAVETKDITSREVSFEGEQGSEMTNDQTTVVDQIEERKEILDSNDQKVDEVKYDIPRETEDADDRQVSTNEASVEQSTEEEAAVEVDTNGVSSVEMGITDAKPTQISTSIDTEISEERHLSSTENIESTDLNEEVAESKEIYDVKEASNDAPLVESAVVEESILDQVTGTETLQEPDTLLVPTEENEVKDQEGQSSEVTDSFPGKQEIDMEEEISHHEQRDLSSALEKTQNLSAADGADITETTIMLEGDIQEVGSQELSTSNLTNEAEHGEYKVQEDDSFRYANTGPAANEVPENPSDDSTLSEKCQPVEEPAVSQGDMSSSLMEDNNNLFSGDAEAQIESSEFFETPKLRGIQEHIGHSEDVQGSVSGISNETPSGSGIENDKDSSDIVEKDLIDGTENDANIDSEEVDVETKDITSREVSFEGEQGPEMITNDQTAVVDQIEEKKEILDSSDQKVDTIKYDTPREIEDVDDHQVSINEAPVEQSTEEEAAVKVETNVVSNAEMGITDAKPSQISRSIDSESSEEMHLGSTENVKSKDLNEEVAESKEIADVKEASDEAPLVESAVGEESILDQVIGTETLHEPDTSLVQAEENEVKDQEGQSSEVTDSFPGKQEIDMEEEISHPEERDLPSAFEKTQNLSAADGADISETTIMLEGDIHEAESRELSTSDLTNEAEHDENKVQGDDSFRLANTGPTANEVPQNPSNESTLSEEYQPVEEPAVSQGDRSSSVMEDNNNNEFSGDAEAQIGSSEFFETPKIQGIQEDIVHSEDVQDSVSGISSETLAGSGIENDKDSTDIVEKNLMNGTENDKKIDAEEVSVETKDITSREVSFVGEQGIEMITNDQTPVVDHIEERKEILGSNDQKVDAIEYDTHRDIEETDDGQVSRNEALVEQSTEEEAAVEGDTNAVSSAEMGIADAKPTQISRSIDTEISEEGHLSSTENIQSRVLNEEVSESKEIVDVKEASNEAPLLESTVVEESILDQSIGTETLHESGTLLVPTDEKEVKDQEGQSSVVTDSFSGKQEIDMEEEISHPEQRDLLSALEKNPDLSAADGVGITETTIKLKGDIQQAESQELSTSDLTNEAGHDQNKNQEDDSFRLENTGPTANEVPESPAEDSTLSEEHLPVEESAVSQGDTSSSLMEDNNNEDKKGIVRPSEFLDEADSALEVKEDTTHFEDVQDSDTGTIDETPSGSVIAKDWDSTDIMEEDLIDGTKNDEKISTGEVTLETKNIDSREVEQDEQLVGESSATEVGITETPESELSSEVEQSAGAILSDQTTVADQTEEESKKILDSEDQNGKAIEYTTPRETADSDDHQTKITDAIVEETKEEKSTVEFDSNVASGTETGADDTESTQVSRGIVTESSEESNPTSDNVESRDLTEEATETEKIINEKEASEDAAHSHSELVESAVAEENVYDESTRKETSRDRDSLLVPPEEIEVKDREAPSSEVPDSFSEKQVIDAEQEVSRPEQTDLVSSEVETNQIFSKAEVVDLTVSTITPEGDNREDKAREIDTSDQTEEEKRTEDKIQEDDSYGIANTDLGASEDAEIPMGGSAISEQRQYMEEPVLSQGDTDASLVDENINKEEGDAVGSSEFRDLTDSIKMINEEVLQTEDIQNTESDIINETPAGTGLAEDKGSAETVAKDVINGTESEAKVDSGEVASETTNIDTREVEQYAQEVKVAASDLQVGLSGTPEAEPSFGVEQVTGVIAADQIVAINPTAEESKEILDSDNQNGEAAHGETAVADDHQASINKHLVEQTAEEKSVAEVESSVISGTEMSTVDTESAQISRNIDAGSFEDRNSTAGNIENTEFFDKEGKYNDESKDQAEEVTKSEEIFDAKETSKEAALANSELVETAVAEEGILYQNVGTKISHEHDSSLVQPEENEAKDREVPSGVGSDDSVKQEQHVEERGLLASEFEKTQTAEIPELSTPDLTKDEVNVENSEGIRGLPIEDDQQEDTQGVFAEEVAPEKEITSKDAEADRIIQEDETSHKEAENSIEAKEDEVNKDGELKDVDEIDTESSVTVEETLATATPATETEDLENKGSYTVADGSLLEAHPYAAGADTPFSERSISDIPPGIQGEILDGENAGELNSATVSVEDIADKEEAFVDSESREIEAIGQTEVSDEAALPNAPHAPSTTLQTPPTDGSYQKDSVLTEENKVNIEGERADDSVIESYGENEREVLDKTSDEQSSQVQIDSDDLGGDAQTRDVPATAENAKIDQSESVEKTTRSSDIGELEQIQSRDLQDQVDNSVPPEAEDGGNESTEVLLNEVETKEGSLEEAQQFAQSAEIMSDEPSDQTSSPSVTDVVLEKEINETVPSENDQMSRTIQEVSEYTDVDGVTAVDTQADVMKASQPTQSANDLTKENIGQMSETVVPGENDNSKEQSSTADSKKTTEESLELTGRQVESFPGGEAELVDIEEIKSASIGESPLDQNPPAEVSQESALLPVTEKEFGNEAFQASAINEVLDYGNESTVQTGISQDDLDIDTAKYELGDRDFASAVQEKEISTLEDSSKIKEVVLEDAVESTDDNIREVAPTNLDTQLSTSSEILDGENAGEHNSAVVSVEDRSKEEGTDAGIEEISKEFSDKSVLSDITNEVAMRIQTEQADDSYEPDSTELAKESKFDVESIPVYGSSIEFNKETDQDIKDETSNEPVLIDNQELAVDMPTRDIQETTENVDIDKRVELDEHTTSAEVEQYQSQQLNAPEELFLQADQIDSSLPLEAKVGANKAENKEALVEEGLPLDGPSNQISNLSTGALDNVHEPETREVVTSEDDQAKGTIEEELDDESRNRVDKEDIAEQIEQEFPSNEERPVIGESVEETKPLDELTQSTEEERIDSKGGENVSEVIKDVYTDIGVAAADIEEGVEEATQPTQSTGEEESIRETSTSITRDENDGLEKEGLVEPTPHEVAMPAEIVDVTPASVGESITEFSKEQPALLHVSGKDAGNEDVQPVVMNDAWSVGSEPTLESDVGQDESYTGGSKSAYKERDIKDTQLELGDRDFIPAVPTKEILQVDASKIEQVESLSAGVAADEEAQEDSGHALGETKDRVQIYEDESSTSEPIINAETVVRHGEAEVSKSEDDTTEEVIPRTSDDSSAVPEKVDVLGSEIEYEKEVSSLGISQRNLPDVTNLEDTNVKEITMDILSTDGQAVPGAASEETVAEKIHFAGDTDGNADGERTILPLSLEEIEETPDVKRVEETGTADDTAEKYIESRNLDFMSAEADQETQSKINIGETLSDDYFMDKAENKLERAAVEIAEKVELPVKRTEEEAFGEDQVLLEKALENKDEHKIGSVEEGKFPILSEAIDSVEKIVDPTPLEKAEEQNVEGEQTDIKAETPIPNVQGSSKQIFNGDQTRTLEESKGTDRAILTERDAPTAYQDAGPQEVVSPETKEFTRDLPGSTGRGLPPGDAGQSGDQSEVKLVSKEFEGEKYEPGNLQLPEEHEYDDHEHVEHSDAAPLISELSKETLDGKPHKKSHHNLLSGMSSKVKSSISKVKKVITGKSSSHGKEKEHSPKHGQ